MRRSNQSLTQGPNLPAPEPTRIAYAGKSDQAYTIGVGNDSETGTRGLVAAPTSRTGLWQARWRNWRDSFEQSVGPKVRKYWQLYRAFDVAPLPGPKQAWRDRTVIPTCFKIIETRVPRIVMGQWGAREWFTVEGRDARDEQYEEMVRTLMRVKIDQIGSRDYSDGGFFKRMIDGTRYCQIMGHVWFKAWWRKENRWLKTKVPIQDEAGKVIGWEPLEVEDNVYDNFDVTWLPLDSLAIDVNYGHGRRWAIERVFTSLQALKAENKEYKRKYGIELYPAERLIELEFGGGGAVQRDSFEEPRDTEHWPLNQESISNSPGETMVEMWLCWDNQEMTLTKIANRNVELDHGLSPTPDGIDPYVAQMAVPVSGRPYGESFLHYVGPLAQYQSRIARARADEVLLNIWQQFVFREGAVRSSQFLFVPGGAMEIEQAEANRPISDNIMVLPRRPVYTEAWTEEAGRQKQAEDVAAADPVSQGNEATQKSRDVSATEIQQRVLQGASRYQMENLYQEVAFKKPLLGKLFDLLRQNLTTPQALRIMNQDVTVDLRNLDRPIDIVVGGGLMEMTKAEKMKEIEASIQLAQVPIFEQWLKPREILTEMYRNNYDRKDPGRFVKTEDEHASDQAQLQAAQMGQQLGTPTATQGEPGAATAEGAGGAPGASGLAGAFGQGAAPPSGESGTVVEDI